MPCFEDSMVEVHDGAGIDGGRLLHWPELPSTNRWALDHMAQLRDGDAIQADRQTDGHGRFGRPWLSPGNQALTLTVALDPERRPYLPASAISQVTALAVRETLAQAGVGARVKWPNDVLADDAKIAGILAERDPRRGMVALGIGVNLNLDAAALAGIAGGLPATSILAITGSLTPVSPFRDHLLANLADALREVSAADWQTRWHRYDALTGKRVHLATPTGTETGLYRGLEPDGALSFVPDGGSLRTVYSGDVTALRPLRG
jgi:BirA family biotin operon repressor/biotin-[acetyl-CoA-carboxylase] ligase